MAKKLTERTDLNVEVEVTVRYKAGQDYGVGHLPFEEQVHVEKIGTTMLVINVDDPEQVSEGVNVVANAARALCEMVNLQTAKIMVLELQPDAIVRAEKREREAIEVHAKIERLHKEQAQSAEIVDKVAADLLEQYPPANEGTT